MKVPFDDLYRQIEPIREQIDIEIDKIIRGSAFIGGDQIKIFETEFAKLHGCLYGLGVANGTDALIIALKCLGIGAGDEVIVPANSYIATSEAVSACGAKPVFIDISEDDFLLDPKKTEEALSNNSKIKAVIPVHLYGRVYNLETLDKWRQQFNVRIIEDAAQAHLGKYGFRNIAEVSDAATFSFFPAKNLGAFGDAGAIISNDQELVEKMRMMANHGRASKYDHKFEGMNSRLDNLQAAVLNLKLAGLEDWTIRRSAHAFRYLELLQETSYLLPQIPEYPQHVLHRFVVRHQKRDKIMQFLKENGVETGIHYPIALPNLDAYSHFNHSREDFPVASRCQDEIFSLPLFSGMTDAEQDYVVEQLKRAESVV